MSEKQENGLMVLESQQIGAMITTMMEPIMEAIGTMLKNNTEAIDRIAATQAVMSDRMEALERQIRLNTPVDTRQERYLSNAMKARARALLDARGLADDSFAVKMLTASIRKSVLSRYGIGSMREIPKHEYTVAMGQIDMWSDMMVIRDVVKEARNRAAGQDVAGVSQSQLDRRE